MKINKKRIGFTCSTFDLFHAGHVAMLKEAKSVCDYLIVGLQVDPTIRDKRKLTVVADRSNKKTPILSVVERYILLRGCKYVDEIIPYVTESDLYDLLRVIPIDVRIMGIEYDMKEFTGKDLQGKLFEVYFNRRYHDYSTTNLRERIKSEK